MTSTDSKPTILGNPQETFAAMRRIADMAYDFWSPDPKGSGPWLQDRRNEKVNPYYHQTTGGLFIIQYYGIPGSIWTPWGEWNCWGCGTGAERLFAEFLDAVGDVRLHQALQVNSMGEFGPVYSVHRVEDVELPEPVDRPRDEFIDYEDANRLWLEISSSHS